MVACQQPPRRLPARTPPLATPERHAVQTPRLHTHTHGTRSFESPIQIASHPATQPRACRIQTSDSNDPPLLPAPALRPPLPPLALARARRRRRAAMETLMVDRVHSSLRLFMHRNAVFLCAPLRAVPLRGSCPAPRPSV
ncbi:hypothetical protein GQ55_4G081200 [Panicum hallii var. hallii]|uniref:Uncharacterized protein n=1 Tax=Panicum hallii var. hallii TaxID=1504633 RepID=A0A2T7DWH1_9POAL|nr:hypothetical protein GQ55_4G081200 [Panicum hallii var. hallii]